MKKEFIRKNDFAVFFDERIKQRDKEIANIVSALDIALNVVDENDYDELLLNIARVMYFYGCRIKENDNERERKKTV